MTGLLQRQVKLPLPRREHVVPTLAYLVLAVILLHAPVLSGRVLYRRDISTLWLPMVETTVASVASGSLPLWDPYAGFGRPLASDPRAEVFYPPAWLELLLPTALYFGLFSCLHLVVGGLGMLLLTRRWGASAWAAFVAGAVWMCSGPFFSLVAEWHALASAAWIPWVFLAADVALSSCRAFHAAGWGIVLALQFLGGSPDMTLLMAPVLGAFVVIKMGEAPRRAAWWPRLRTVLLAVAIGASLAAVLWLPTLAWIARSQRSTLSRAARTVWSLHPASLLEIVVPFRWNWTPLSPRGVATILAWREPFFRSIFLGPAGLALVAAGLLGRSRHRILLGVTLAGGIAFSLGAYAPFYDVIVALIPPLKTMRFPVKAMAIAAFAWSALAAGGFDRWLDLAAQVRRRMVLAAVPVLMLALGLAGVVFFAHGDATAGGLFMPVSQSERPDFLPQLILRFVFAALLSGALILMLTPAVTRRLEWKGFAATMTALVVVPLLLMHNDLHATAPASFLTARPPVLDVMPHGPLTRLYVYDYSIAGAVRRDTNPGLDETVGYLAGVPAGWTPVETSFLASQLYLLPPTAGRWRVFGSFDMDILGMDPVPLARLNRFLRAVEDRPAAHTRLLRMGAVSYALSRIAGTWTRDLQLVATVSSLYRRPILVYRVPDPLPRAYVVGRARVAGDDQALALFGSPAFDPEREVVIAGAHGSAGFEGEASAPPGTATIRAWAPDRVRIAADLAADGYVVVVDAYDPGWRATVDGRPTSILRANVAFRAVRVPQGHHDIEMVYRPARLLWGAALSLAALALCGALFVTGRRSQGEGPSQP